MSLKIGIAGLPSSMVQPTASEKKIWYDTIGNRTREIGVFEKQKSLSQILRQWRSTQRPVLMRSLASPDLVAAPIGAARSSIKCEIKLSVEGIFNKYREYISIKSKIGELEQKLADGETALQDELTQAKKLQRAALGELGILESKLVGIVNVALNQKDAIKIEDLPVRVSDPRSFSLISENLDFYQALIEKKLVNRFQFLCSVLEKTRAHQVQILRIFAPAASSTAKIEIRLKVLGEETHNKGGSAVTVLFVTEGRELCKVVYKPRNAETELAIIELFRELNRLSSEEPLLPEYKILNFPEFSFWEFIQGEQIHTDPASYLESLSGASLEKEQSIKSLIYLTTICKEIGVTDLHHENVLLVSPRMRWIPIDMEVIKPGHITGLFGNRPEKLKPDLSDDERRIIQKFKEDQSTRLFRNVPIATAALTEALIDRDPKKLCELIKQGLSAFNITMPDDKLVELLNEDIMNNDVPFFSQKEGILYYGNQLSSEFIIGQLQIKE